MTTGATPFSHLSTAFFSPLTGRLAPIYWAVLERCYLHDLNAPYLTKARALETAEDVVRTSALWTESHARVVAELDHDEQADAASEAPTGHASGDASSNDDIEADIARRLLARLEMCGWFHYEHQTGRGLVVNINPWPSRILALLMRMTYDAPPGLQEYTAMLLSTLAPERLADDAGPKLRVVARETGEWVRELKVLDRNIYASTKRLLSEAKEAPAVLAERFDMYDRYIAGDYHRIKTSDNFYRVRDRLLAQVDAFEANDRLYADAVAYVQAANASDEATAQTSVADDFARIRERLDAVPDILRSIDGRHARFGSLVNRKLQYLLHHDRRFEGELEAAIEALRRPKSPELEVDLFACQLLGDDCLFVPPRARQRVLPPPIRRRQPVDEAAKRALAQALFDKAYGRPRLEREMLAALTSYTTMTPATFPVTNDNQYVQAIYRVAYGRDGKSAYRFEPTTCGGRRRCRQPACTHCYLTFGIYRIPNGTFSRRPTPAP